MLWWLTQNTLTAAVMAGVVCLACRLFRLSPAVRHALWLIVLLKLVTPPLVQWPWQVPAPAWAVRAGLPGDAGPRADRADKLTELQVVLADLAAAEGQDLHAPLLGPLPAEVDPLRLQTLPLEEVPSAGADPAPGWQPPRWLAPLALFGWLGGTAGMVVLQAVRIVRFRRLLAGGRRPPGWLERLVGGLAAHFVVRRPRTLVAPGVGTPLLWSLGRPTLVWPAVLTAGLPPSCRRSVVAHELAHLRRRDHWVGWLLLVGECLWWWNPLFWYVRRQVRQNAELACDAWVVWALPEDRRAYAEALIGVSEMISGSAAPVPALGMGGGPRHAFEQRLLMIVRERVPCRVTLGGLAAAGLLALLALPGWSLAQRVEEVEKVIKPDGEIAIKVELAAELEDTKDRVIRLEAKPRLKDGVLRLEVKPEGGKDRVIRLERKPRKDELQVEVKVLPLERKIEALQQLGVEVRLVEPQDVFVTKVQAAPGDREKKLEELEKKLDALLKEIRSLRGQSAKPQDVLIERKGVPKIVEAKPPLRPLRMHIPQTTTQLRILTDRSHSLSLAEVVSDKSKVLTLTRATYKLDPAKAGALAKFLQEHIKAAVMEVKVDGGTLIITTTPEAQKAVGQLIELLRAGKDQGSQSKAPQGEWKLELAKPEQGGTFDYRIRVTDPKDETKAKDQWNYEPVKEGGKTLYHRYRIADQKDEEKAKEKEKKK